jgi:tetratricopeptide (TPR) repeat protein
VKRDALPALLPISSKRSPALSEALPPKVRECNSYSTADRDSGCIIKAQARPSLGATRLNSVLRSEIVTSLNNLGKAYCSLEQYQQAIDCYGQSLLIAQEIGVSKAGRDKSLRQMEATLLGNLGDAYRALGQYQQAIEFHQQSLLIKRELGDRAGTAVSLNKLGKACCGLGEYERAIDFYQSSLEMAREISDRSGEAHSLAGLSKIYYCLGEYQRANAYHHKSLSLVKELGECLVLQ